MTERPLLLRGPQVRAFREGGQTQDRRPMVPQPGKYVGSTFEPAEPKGNISFEHHWTPLDFERDSENKDEWWCFADGWAAVKNWRCPFGKPGDRLWVRETWRVAEIAKCSQQELMVTVQYADLGIMPKVKYVTLPEDDRILAKIKNAKWRPSIHMPRWASRLTLEIERVRVERVQSISEDDAIAEAVEKNWIGQDCPPEYENEWRNYLGTEDDLPCFSAKQSFATLWDSIYAKTYPWSSNPWVWVMDLKVVK